MSLLRFKQIKRFLHVSHLITVKVVSFFFYKLEPLLNAVSTASKKLGFPKTRLSVDEMMVMNYGRSAETVRMRNKPIGSGFKIWAICDSGYMFYCFPHSNKKPWKHCMRYKGTLPHFSSVVAQLTDALGCTLLQEQNESGDWRPVGYWS